MQTRRHAFVAVILAAIAVSGFASETQSATSKELHKRTTKFCENLAHGKTDEAKKELFTKSDDPDLEIADAIAQLLPNDFAKFAALLSNSNAPLQIKQIKILDPIQNFGRTLAPVEVWGVDPGESELEKRKMGWIQTKKSGWKIIDL